MDETDKTIIIALPLWHYGKLNKFIWPVPLLHVLSKLLPCSLALFVPISRHFVHPSRCPSARHSLKCLPVSVSTPSSYSSVYSSLIYPPTFLFDPHFRKITRSPESLSKCFVLLSLCFPHSYTPSLLVTANLSSQSPSHLTWVSASFGLIYPSFCLPSSPHLPFVLVHDGWLAQW